MKFQAINPGRTKPKHLHLGFANEVGTQIMFE